MSTNDIESRRKPPPAAQRYKQGQSGNLQGRPKGTVSTKLLTRKIALKRFTREVNGKKQTLTLLEYAILTARAMQVEGHAGAAALLQDVLAKVSPPDPEMGGGFLLVPEVLTPEEAKAMMERHNALVESHEPGRED
jgi:hypothetical protein